MNFLQRFSPHAHDVAIDLGTVNTVIYVRGQGIVLNEPSVIALETRDGVRSVKVVGNDAKLIRTEKGASKTYELHLSNLLKDGDLAANMKLMPGDVIRIPERWF